MDWNKVTEQLAEGTKQRLGGLDQLTEYVQENHLTKEQLSDFVDLSGQLLGDNNFKVALKTLQAWETLTVNQGDAIKPYVNSLLPPVVERLSDNRQDVRQAACNCLLELLQVLRPEQMIDRISRFWGHKHWKVRHGLLQFVAEAICLAGPSVLAPTRAGDEKTSVTHQVIKLAEDPESAVRDAAVECLEEIYKVIGDQLVDMLSRHTLRPAQLREIYARLAQHGAAVEAAAAGAASPSASEATVGSGRPATLTAAAVAANDSAQGLVSRGGAGKQRPASAAAVGYGAKRAGGEEGDDASSVSEVGSTRPSTAGMRRGGFMDAGGVTAGNELPEAKALSVGSERDLRAELERIRPTMAITVDWNKRIDAMVKIEGLVKGGAYGMYPEAFLEQLRVLRDALVVQINDRRSAISRQACHLLGVLARAMGMVFEPYAVHFLPLLFKILVITKQVISESADKCVRTLLQHCHSPGVVLKIGESLATDKSAKLRQHCSAFLLQVLEEWDVSEYSRHLDVVETAIERGAQDAMGETRSMSRSAFAAYSRAAPERAVALLRRFDGGLQEKMAAAASSYEPGAIPRAVASVLPVVGAQRAATLPPRLHRVGLAAAAKAAGAPSAGPAIEIHVAEPPQRRAVAASRQGSAYGNGDMPPPPVRAPSAAAAVKPGRKSVAGVPMRVPGMAVESAEPHAHEAPTDMRAALLSRNRRNSVLPQRVPSTEPTPARHQPAARAASTTHSAHSDSTTIKAARPGTPDSEHTSRHSQHHYGHNSHHDAGSSRSGDTAAAATAAATAAGHAARAMSSGGDDLRVHGMLRDQHEGAAAHAGNSSGSAGMAGAHGGSGLSRAGAVAKAVAAIMAVPRTWSDKVDRFNALAELLTQQASQPAASAGMISDVERVLPKLLSHMDDPHFKVSLAALGVVESAFAAVPAALEGNLDKLMPLLFLKLVGQKQQTQAAAEAALQACAMSYSADVLLPALTRSLEAVKQPAGKSAVMEFTVLFMGPDKASGVPSAQPGLRQWVARIVPLLLDKHPDIRGMAAKSLHTIHDIDPSTVEAYLAHASAQEVLAVRRIIVAADSEQHAEEGEEVLHHTEHYGAEVAAANHNSAHRDAVQSGYEQDAVQAELQQHRQRLQQQQQQQQQAAAAYNSSHGLYSGAGGSGPDQGDFHGGLNGLSTQHQQPATAGSYVSVRDRATPYNAAYPADIATPLQPPSTHTSSPSHAQYTLPAVRSTAVATAAAAGGVGAPGSPMGSSVGSETGVEQQAAAVPTDPAAQNRQLTVLVHRLQTKPGEDVLAELTACCAALSKETWEANFSKVLLAALAAAKHSRESVREMAFVLIRALAQNHAEQFEHVLDVAMQPLLMGCADSSREVLVAAHATLECLMDAMPPRTSLEVLRYKLPSPEAVSSGTAVDGDVLCAAIRCLQRALGRMNPRELMACVPGDVLPGLVAAFQHPRPDVRKAVVFCLVDMWCAVGECLTPYLTSLSTSQLKLLTIYVERAQQKQQQLHNGTMGSIPYHGMAAMQSGSPYARH